jgi:ATPase subunit of ABC transporter with duplicated ATPase domains
MIRLQQVVLARGTKPLFDSVDVTLNPGDKIGLIGSNGAANPVCLRCCAASCIRIRAA